MIPCWQCPRPADLKNLAEPRVLTIGVFDGLHRGHQRLLAQTIEAARADNGAALLLTFQEHPLSLLAPAYKPKRLLSEERRRHILAKMGLDGMITLPFDHDFAAQEPEAFLQLYVRDICRASQLFVGFDFRFGRDGKGDRSTLERAGKELGFAVEVLPAVFQNEWAVSSTRIRELIEEGRLETAGAMLGRPYEMEGEVIAGYGRGSQIGYPTANFDFDSAFAMPPSGVYAVLVHDGQDLHQGMMNIGCSPTFEGSSYRPEAFLLDYDGPSLYGEKLRVFFIGRMRDERRFSGVEALKEQLVIDENKARQVLSHVQQESLFL